MGRKIEVDTWVDHDENVKGLKKSEWVRNYLDEHIKQRQLSPLFGAPTKEDIKSILHNLLHNDQADFVKSMKTAWSRAKYQEKNRNKNIALSDPAHKKLISLVKESKSTIKSTLENIILDTYLAVRDSRVKEKQEKERLKAKEKKEMEEALSIPTHRLTFSLQAKQHLENRVSKAEGELKKQEDTVKKQRLTILEYEEFLLDLVVKHDLDASYLDLPISNVQKSNAREMFEEGQPPISKVNNDTAN
jgi:hypothetical protein